MSVAVFIEPRASAALAPASDAELDACSLLLLCVGNEPGTKKSAQLERMLHSAIDWPRFLELSERNEVSAMVYQALSGWPELVPAPVLNWLHARAVAAIAQHHILSSQLVDIVDCFERRSIPVVALKGPATATVLYRKPWLRHSGDLDLLVPEGRAREARDLLLDRGFRIVRDKEPGRSGRDEKHFVLLNADETIVVELHWDFHEPAFHFRLKSRAIFESATPVVLHGRNVPCVSPEWLLLLLSVHGARHGWDSLKWICDIAELVRSQPPFVLRDARARARELGCERMLQLALRLSGTILAGEADQVRLERATDANLDWLVREVCRNLLVLGPVTGAPATVAAVNARNFAFLLRCREGVWTRVRLTFSHIAHELKPNQVDRAYVKLPRWLNPLYGLVRPVRILRTYGLGSILQACGLLLRNTSRLT